MSEPNKAAEDGNLLLIPRPLSRLALVIFGTLLALTALEAGMRIVGCAVVNAQDRDNSRRLNQQHQLRVM